MEQSSVSIGPPIIKFLVDIGRILTTRGDSEIYICTTFCRARTQMTLHANYKLSK